jgi:hypothetical protein
MNIYFGRFGIIPFVLRFPLFWLPHESSAKMASHTLGHRHVAWGVQRGRRRPEATLETAVSGVVHSQGRVGHDGLRWNFRESMATPFHTPMIIRQNFCFACPLISVLSERRSSSHPIRQVDGHSHPEDSFRLCYSKFVIIVILYCLETNTPMGAGQELAMDSLKFRPGPSCPTPLRLAPLKRL